MALYLMRAEQRSMACQARFERAIWALEAFVTAEICNYFNDSQLGKDNVVF